MENKIDVWYILNNILVDKTPLKWSAELEKAYDQFLINRVLSSESENIGLVCSLNEQASDMSKEMHYKILFNSVRKRKRFLKFLKEKRLDKNIEVLAGFNMVGKNEVNEYSEFINPKDIENFVNFLEAQENPKFKKLTK